jgi:hypothetical protein
MESALLAGDSDHLHAASLTFTCPHLECHLRVNELIRRQLLALYRKSPRIHTEVFEETIGKVVTVPSARERVQFIEDR